MPSYAYFLLPASLAALALAKTDLTGCTSTDVSSPAGASIAWYVPGTGELCDFLDCGGGRAPAKTNVPGCPLYSGTSTYSPSYMSGWASTASAAAASSTVSQASETTSSVVWSALKTDSASSSWDLYTTAPAGYVSSAWSSVTATAAASNISAISSAFASASASAYSSWSSAVAHNGTMVTVSGATNGTTIAGHSSGAVKNSTMLLSVTASATGSSRSTITSVAIGSASGSTTGGAASATTGAGASGTSSAANGAETAKAWMGAGLVMGLGVVVAAL